jgi:hypothetical protein
MDASAGFLFESGRLRALRAGRASNRAAPQQQGALMTTGADTTPPRGRVTGVVYLLCFLTAVSDEAFVGRGRLFVFDAFNLIADAFYIAVTLLFYSGEQEPLSARGDSQPRGMRQ